MSEDIDDQYHIDYTTASEWEIFIARLVEIIHEWKVAHITLGSSLKAGQLFNCSWETKTENVSFAGELRESG